MDLADSDRDFYWDNGYLLLPGLIDPESVERLEARFLALLEERVPRPEGLIVMRDVMVVKGAVQPASPVHEVNKILSFENDPELFAYALDARILGPVRALLGPDVQSISSNVFNKPPEIDGRHPLHQDLRYFALRPADGILGTWTAISPVQRENGCLAIVPGSHRLGLLRHRAPDWEFVNDGFQGAAGIDPESRVHVEMAPGDTLLMHPLLVHGSGRNRSSACRRAISVHYASQACSRPPGPRKRAPVIRAIPAGPAVASAEKGSVSG